MSNKTGDLIPLYDPRYRAATTTATGARNYIMKIVAAGASPSDAPADVLKRAGGYVINRSGANPQPPKRKFPDGTPWPEGVEF